MKTLLLFALLCVPAFGQVHSDIATQNTVGNWVKVVPGALVYVCDPNTADASCLIGTGVTTLYTTSGLTTPTTQPITADSNGNYTFYATPGIYKQCVKGTTSFCQQIQVAGIGTQNGIPFNCPAAVNGSVVGMTSTITSSCDPNGITDFLGHWTSQSYRATGAFNGTVELTGGLADPTNPPDTNSFAFLAPLTVPTPYYLRPPASTGSVGQCLQLLSQAAGTNGTIDALQWATCSAGAGTVTSVGLALPAIFTVTNSPVTTTGTLTGTFNNAGADYLPTGTAANTAAWELINGGASCGDSSHAVSYDISTHKFGCQAISTTSIPQASNPSAPTLTPNTPGSTAYSYAVVGCEDVNCAYHSAMSATTTTSTGNANLATGTMKLTLYADTLYGYRFYKICRTASSGTPSTIGVIATGAWKQFVDSGLVGDGTNCASTYASNTTVLDQHCLASANPVALNVMPGAPCGIDSPPTTPFALTTEWTEQLGAPGDANNPQFVWRNQGTSTAVLTGGELLFTPQPGVGADAFRLLVMTPPATPYTFVTTILPMWTNGTQNQITGVCIGDGTKFISYGSKSNNINGEIEVDRWTNTTTFSANSFGLTQQTTGPTWIYFKVQNNGTNLVYSHGFDGINYIQDFTEAKGAFLGTITEFGPCADSTQTAATPTMSVDYVRQTQ